MAKNPGGKNILNAMRETLDSVVTPSVRDAILLRALSEAQRKELPIEPSELSAFVQGPLQDALVRSLGPELGMSVSNELEHLMSLAVKDAAARSERPTTVRPGRPKQNSPAVRSVPKLGATSRPKVPAAETSTRRRSRSTMPSRAMAPTLPATASPTSADYPAGTAQALGVIGSLSVDPKGGRRPMVFIASGESGLVRSFESWLDVRATVEHVVGASALLRRISDIDQQRVVVVLDGKNPSIRPLTLAALAEELPPGTTVMLWGVAPHVHARMCTIAALAEKWLVMAGDSTTEEVVGRCAKLVG